MYTFKLGDYVQYGTVVTTVSEIKKDVLKLRNGVICKTDDVIPISICGGSDKCILLDCITPIRAKICLKSSTRPLMTKPKYFYDSNIDDIPMSTIVKENSLTYIHEVQAWLKTNKPNYYLTSYIKKTIDK